MRRLVLESLHSPKLAKLCNVLWTGRWNGLEQLEKVDEYLRSNFQYVGETIETVQAPEWMLNHKEMNGFFYGDCDDISTLEAAILTGLGIPVRFVVIRSKPNSEGYDHVYIEANIDNKWIASDITVQRGTKHVYYQRLEINV